MLRLLIVLVSGFLGINSCKPAGVSQVKHELGATSRKTDGYNFQSCELSFESKKRFPKTQAYLQKIADSIMSKNPKVFKKDSNLDPEKFCINITENDTFGASALPTHRDILFHTATILAAENDAILAAIMAHELSHITMLHGLVKHPKFKPTPRVMEMFKLLRSLTEEMGSMMMQVNKKVDNIMLAIENRDDFSKEEKERLQANLILFLEETPESIIDEYGNVRLTSYADTRNAYLKHIPDAIKASVVQSLDSIVQMIIDTAPISAQMDKLRLNLMSQMIKSSDFGLAEGANWQEQEADEVGFEFYRRAGFRDDEFFNMLHLLATIEGVPNRDVISCMQKSFQYLAMKNKNFEQARGRSTHPSYCWRIYGYQKEEILHQKDYEPFPRRTTVDIGGLVNARAEIMGRVKQKSWDSGAAIGSQEGAGGSRQLS